MNILNLVESLSNFSYILKNFLQNYSNIYKCFVKYGKIIWQCKIENLKLNLFLYVFIRKYIFEIYNMFGLFL